MKTDKEYPATHSMETAWFGIDSEGNVAIFDFEENGPVPIYVTHADASAEIVVSDYFTTNKEIKEFLLPSDQLSEITKRLKRWTKKEQLDLTVLVKINTIWQKDFLDIFIRFWKKRKGIWDDCEPVCLSYSEGLYIIDAFELPHKDLEFLWKNKVILKIAPWNLTNYIEWDAVKKVDVYKHRFQHLPFFLYQQPYSQQCLIERTYIPDFPVKEAQLPPDAQRLAMRFPFRFSDTVNIQIAQYYPSDAYFSGDNEMDVLALPGEKSARICKSGMPYHRCKKNCKRCFVSKHKYITGFIPEQADDEPTIVVLYGWWNKGKWRRYGDIEGITQKWVAIPLIRAYPCQEDWNGYSDVEYDEAICEEIFKTCKCYLEEAVKFLRPNLIVIPDKALPLLRKYYKIENGVITFGSESYPYIADSGCEKYKQKVIDAASGPYRGKKMNRIVKIFDKPIDLEND